MKNNVCILKMSLKNFKGIKDLEIDFNQNTNIYGDNGTGKTSIFDAFTWLLFGKDSTGRSNFEVKTLDANNVVIPKIEHEVCAVLSMGANDGTTPEEWEFKRVLREKWVKKKGSETAEFTGNETQFFWNKVPLTSAEYDKKVNMVMDETVFKLLTNPLAFNDLNWKERRNILVLLAGAVDNDDVLKALDHSQELTKPQVDDLIHLINGKLSLEEQRKQTAAQKKQYRDELKAIPTRIDEAKRNVPQTLDFEAIQKDLEVWEKGLEKLDGQINDKSKAMEAVLEQRAELQKEMYAIQSKIDLRGDIITKRIKNDNRVDTSEVDALKQDLAKTENLAGQYAANIRDAKEQKDQLENQMAELRTKFEELNASQIAFDPNAEKCPTCHRGYDPQKIQEERAAAEKRFNDNKKAELQRIRTAGQIKKADCEKLTAQILEWGPKHDELKENAAELQKQITALGKTDAAPVDVPKLIAETLAADPELIKLKKEKQELEAQLEFVPTVDNSELVNLKKQTIGNIDICKTKLAVKTQIDKANARVDELLAQEKQLAQDLSNLERSEFALEKFIKTKITMLENRINQKFTHVNFRLFQTQINGGEVETCDTLINGVPFSDANNAAKINAGLDIINTLCDHYGTTAPIFVDNKESITKLIPVQSQVVALIVSENDKTLRIQ
ncbi:AAA domain-containing protein [Thalassospira sp. 11-3]|nr:AAA domain-containing protein [Thalassospira sp. 11-3]